jgi:hypothetical protein
MGIGCFLATGKVTNPGAALTAITVNSGDSLQVPSFNKAAGGYLENAWAHSATPGVLRIRSPKFHDNVQGIRLTVPSAEARPLLPDYADQPVVTLDTLTVELSGGGAETDVAALQFYINDLDGAAQNLATWDQIKPRIQNILTIEVDVAAPGTIGTWSAGSAINATFDQLHADKAYAIFGWTVSAACAAIAISGPDTSQLKIGGPGVANATVTRSYFIDQGYYSGRPHIPIIKAPNKGATSVFTLSASAPAAINVGLIAAELSPS